jgi:hypothetical protein
LADIKIPDLPAVGTPAAGDLFEGVEIADTTDDPAGSSKYYTATQIVNAGGVDVRTAAAWVSANPVLTAGFIGIESDTGVVRIGDGATAFISLSSGWRTYKQTAQVTNQDSTTSVDITGLAVPVQSGHLYKIQFEISFQSATNTNGLTLLTSGPAQTFGRWRAFMQQGGSGTDQYFNQSSGTAFGGTSTSSAVVTANTTYNAFAEGIVKPSADGTFQLRFRPEVAGNTAAELITVLNEGLVTVIDCGV